MMWIEDVGIKVGLCVMLMEVGSGMMLEAVSLAAEVVEVVLKRSSCVIPVTV
jgi:hypothetical protein